jgi:apolipoprotein N-acyltransferase
MRTGDDGTARAATPVPNVRSRVTAWPRPLRVLAGTLVAWSGASLWLILLAVLRATDPPVTPPVLLWSLTVLALLPALGAAALRHAFAATVTVGGGTLEIRRRDLRVEVPLAAIAAVEPWTVPLPAPGVALRLASGARLRWGLATPDPSPLVHALAAAGVAGAAVAHPTCRWARAKAAAGRWRWRHLVAKYPAFALPPAAALFNAHQHIAYGGLLGEWYLLGPGAWLRTLALHWATTTAYLVLYASVWRGLAEAAALLAAHVAPSRAARVRRAVEGAARVGYYAGVPVLLVRRFLP